MLNYFMYAFLFQQSTINILICLISPWETSITDGCNTLLQKLLFLMIKVTLKATRRNFV